MTNAHAAQLLDDTLAMMARERDLLLAGRFAELERTAAARDAQLAELIPMERGLAEALAPRLHALRRAASRNRALFKAALDGVAAARRRVGAIEAAATKLTGYDASGAPVNAAVTIPGGRRA